MIAWSDIYGRPIKVEAPAYCYRDAAGAVVRITWIDLAGTLRTSGA